MPKSLIHNEDLIAWLLRGAENGASYEDCGSMVGISGGTVSNWVKRGRDLLATVQEGDTELSEDEYAYVKFAVDFQQAQAVGRVKVLEQLREHHDWRAQVQWLARTSDAYKDVDKKQIEVTGAGGGPLDIGVLVSSAVAQLDAVDHASALQKAQEFLDEGKVVEGSVNDN